MSAKAPRIIAWGDSVMVGAKDQLVARLGRGFSMNAKVGRQVDEVIALARQLKAGGHHPNDLIIQIGNNGPLYSEEMDALRVATSEAGHIFLINDHAPVSWVNESNDELAQAAKEWPHTSLIDWSAAAKTRSGLFWDGIHLTPAGAAYYARLSSRRLCTPKPGPPHLTPGIVAGAAAPVGARRASVVGAHGASFRFDLRRVHGKQGDKARGNVGGSHPLPCVISAAAGAGSSKWSASQVRGPPTSTGCTPINTPPPNR